MPQTTGLTSLTSPRPETAQPGRPLLAPDFRAVAGAIAAACAGLTTFLAVQVTHQSSPGWLDYRVDSTIEAHTRGFTPVLAALARLGDPRIVTLIGVAAFCVCVATRRYRAASLFAVALPVAGLAEVLLKPFIDRTRYGFLSFPSGHAIGVFALAVTFVVLLIGPIRPPLPATARVLLACGALLTGCAVAVSLIALGMHYFTDTVGGAAVSISVVLVAALLVDGLADRGLRSGQRAATSELR
jgi:membrane-associated phospholipid phosphatase